MLVEILTNESQESGNPPSLLKSLRNKVIKLKKAIQATHYPKNDPTFLLNVTTSIKNNKENAEIETRE